MSPEIPQRCPRCGSNDKELYLPKCQDEYWTGDAHPWHTAPVPAPEPAICNACLLSLIDKTKPAAAPAGTPACPKCGPNAVCDHQGWVYNPDERLKEMREKKTAPTGTGEGSELPRPYIDAHGIWQRPSIAPEPALSLDELLKPLKDVCDRSWKDELPEQIVAIATNAIYWRQTENAALRSQLAEAQKYNAHFCAAIGPMDEFDTYEDVIQRIKKMQQDLATAQARIARLEKALRPFALMARFASGGESHVTCSVRWDDLERAERALAEPQSGEK